MSPIPLHLRDFISPSPSPSSPRSTSFTSNPSLPWIIIGIVLGLTILATSTTIIIISYNRRQRQKQNANPTPSQSQLVTPSTTQLQQQQEQSSSLPLGFLRRKSSTPSTSQFEQEELQRASMIRKSYASRSWNSLSLDSQMSLSQLSPTRTVGTLGTYGSPSRVNTLESANTNATDMNATRNNNTRNEEDLDMETPTTPAELRGTTATNEEEGENVTSRLKDDWKAWEARVKLERSVSGELHPVYTGAGAGAETEGGVARTAKVEVPIPSRHPGRVVSTPLNMI